MALPFILNGTTLVKYIGDSTTVNLSYFANIRTIDASAFLGCPKLQTLILPEGVRKIRGRFSNNPNLREIIKADDTPIKIVGNPFVNTEWFKTQIKNHGYALLEGSLLGYRYSGSDISVFPEPEKITHIPIDLFCSDQNITSIDLRSLTQLSRIDPFAFYMCENLEEVDLSNNPKLNKIEEGNFSLCRRLAYVKLHNNIFDIHSTCFDGTRYRKTMELEHKSGAFIINNLFVDGHNMKKISTTRRLDLSKEEDVTVICSKAFNLTPISSVILPPNLVAIMNNSFDFCTNLKTAKFPDSLEYIGHFGFGNCPSLKRQNFWDSDKILIEDDAFMEASE